MIQELPESAKRVVDMTAPVATATTAVTWSVTLNELAAIVTIMTGLVSLAWYIWRFYKDLKTDEERPR